jgi:single-strand DNA-binding protein
MNKVILIGNLSKEPELTTTPNGVSVARFSVAVQRKYSNEQGQKEADFINCVAWRTTAENLQKYCKKGDKIAVVGRIETRSYDAQDGTKRYLTEVIADEVEFVNTKKADDGSTVPQPDLQPVDDDQTLPF